MSRGRRQMIQLNEPARVLYSNEPTHDIDDDDDDSAGDMPTPERLVTDDMIPNRDGAAVGQRMPYEIDNKVANFLAEIDALDPSQDIESTQSPAPAPVRHNDLSPVREKYSPARDKSPVRTKHNAYSNMFVKGTPEFVHKPDEKKMTSGNKQIEPWPEEPKTDWQQLKDESTNYPYYWNTVTNDVVWDMPPEFSQYLLRQKEYEEKVERGLREGTLDPDRKGKKDSEQETTSASTKVEPSEDQKAEIKQSTEHKPRHYSDDSADSSSDSSDSDSPKHYYKKRDKNKKNDKSHEVSSSSAEHRKISSHDKVKRSVTPELPDSTKCEDNKKETIVPAVVKKDEADDSMDFDIDDIDKELELALERKRQELMKLEEKKGEEKADEGDKNKRKDKKKDDRRHRDDDRRDDRRHKHSKHRDSDRKHHSEDSKEEKKPKLTLKERLRIEMELKLEKERRKKKAIEDLMARELEQTVGGRSHKRSRDDKDKPHKHYYHDDGRGDRRGSRDDYRDYDRGYDSWMDRGSRVYDDRFIPPPMMKPPPPTDEMIAYEEERRSQLVDYGHGRSRPYEGDSDGEESRSADYREMEVKKLEALQLAELALSKLEFLEVTKKGLSKLQILLIELETRHQDWQSGGLTTNHFLTKLKEANWQLEQYEASAPPPGWVCCWDRDYRRYFYTHKLTGKNQWDYPDADDIRIEDEQAKDCKKPTSRNQEPDSSEISSTSDKGKSQFMEKEILASMSLPPPPPPPAEEHPSVKSLQLMYGSSSDSESEEPHAKKAKKVSEATLIQNVPLPPEESHKKERHKKKKKKEKSKHKDKDKEKSESGIVGPVGPVYPTVSFQPPPPPPDSGTSTVSNQQQVTIATGDQPNTSEVPVYGTFGDNQTGQNDQPLEFGTVPETESTTEGMEGVETSTISQGPQINPVNYEDPYSNVQGYAETSTNNEQVNEVTHGETSHETTVSAQQLAVDEKKKKKKEKMGSGSISLKKKHVSSMVQKWQKVKKEVELEEQHRQIREAEIRRKLAELE
ncbi:Formin binding protein 4 [Mactra antiquata]